MPGNHQSTEVSASELKPTLGFICPLYIELDAVKAIFDEELFDRPVEKYDNGELQNYYYYGKIASRVAVAITFAEKKVGPDWAVLHAERLLRFHESLRENTSLCFLVGIAGGIWNSKKDVRLGDVVVATKVVDWTSGKVNTGNEFESTQYPQDVSDELGYMLPRFYNEIAELDRCIQEQADIMMPKDPNKRKLWECPGASEDILFKADVPHGDGNDCQGCERRIEHRDARVPYLPRLHSGLIATGSVVLKDAETRERLRGYQKNKVLAVEMEASAVLKAHKKFIIIRGICDYADSHKNKRWQRYAATTAAACARLWINHFMSEIESRQQQPPSSGEQEEQGKPHTQIDFSERVPSLYHPSSSLDRLDSTPNRPCRACTDSSGVSYKHESDDSDSSNDKVSIPIDEDSWHSSLKAKASEIWIKICDGGELGECVTKSWITADIVFDSSKSTQHLHAHHRLKVIEMDGHKQVSHSIWLPRTQVRVKCKGAVVELQFSNCNQRAQRRSGQFPTKNGVTSYTTVYEPTKPNVSMEIHLLHEEEAQVLSNYILSREWDDSVLESSLRKDFSHCTIVHSAISTGLDKSNVLLVWSASNSYEQHDLGCFSDQIDFTVERPNNMSHVSLGYMNKIHYQPIDTQPYASEPPLKIRENHEGRPRRTKFEGGNQASSRLKMTVDEQEICGLLSATVGHLVSWEMMSSALGVEISLLKRGLLKRNLTLGRATLCVWTNTRCQRILIRFEEHTPQSECRQWVAVTILQDIRNADSPPSLKLISDRDAVLENVNLEDGDCLSAETFLPVCEVNDNRKNRKHVHPDWRSFKTSFSSESDRRAFEQSLRNSVTFNS